MKHINEKKTKNAPLSPNPLLLHPWPWAEGCNWSSLIFFLHSGCGSQGTAVPFSFPAPYPGGEPEKRGWA